MIFATDPRDLTPIMKETLFNTELISVHQDPNPRPAMGAVRISTGACGGTAPCELWARAPGTDKAYYVIMYNPNAAGSRNVSFSFTWAAIGLPAGAQATVRDLWAHKDLGSFTGSYATAADIAPHEARTLKVSPM